MVDPTNSPSSEEELSPIQPEDGLGESESTEEGEPNLTEATDDSMESPAEEEGLPVESVGKELNVEDPQPVPVQTEHDWLEETPAGANIPAAIPHSASESQDELVEAALAQITEAVDDAEPGILHGDDIPPELAAITQLDHGEEPPQEEVQHAAEAELESQAVYDAEEPEDEDEPEPVKAIPKPAAKASTKPTEKPGKKSDKSDEPAEQTEEAAVNPHAAEMKWYVLKVSSNQESSVRDSLLWRIKLEGLEEFFGEIIIPTEKVAEKTKTGKKRIVKRKLFPGYMMIHMVLNDETWYLVRDTNGISDFTGAAGKPIPMQAHEVARMLGQPVDAKTGVPTGKAKKEEDEVTIDIPYTEGDTVKINDGSFEGWEGVIDKVDAVNGKITVMVKILGQETPVELEYWQVEGA